MPPKKKSNIAKFHAGELDKVAQEQQKEIDRLERLIERRTKKIEELKGKSLKLLPKSSKNINPDYKKRRLLNPTKGTHPLLLKQYRRSETWDVCQAIHGGTDTDVKPTMTGMLDTLVVKTPVIELTNEIIGKPILKKHLTVKLVTSNNRSYYSSMENKTRSLSVYYSHHVMGKRKYISIRRANRNSDGSNFIQYKDLAEFIRRIDIGTINDVNDINPTDSRVAGVYRNLAEYALRLAAFYLRVDKERVDKLKFFPTSVKKDPEAKVFLMAIGGDGAPQVGTLFLLSSMNVVK